MLGKYIQILLLLGILLGSLASSGDVKCEDSDWLSEAYKTDSCYSCKSNDELQTFCNSYLAGEDPIPLACCGSEHGYGYDYRNVMPTEVDAIPTDTDDYEVYNYDYDTEEYSGFDNYDDYELPDPDDLEGFYNSDASDSDSDSDNEDFPGSDLNDDEFAGPITNEDIGGNLVLPLLSSRPESFIDSEPIISISPSPVDFSAPSDCYLADILGNNYIDELYDAQQQCISDLKLKLKEELNNFLEEVSETKANFENFLEQHSDELTQDELEEVRTQMSELDTKVIERSQSMGEQLQNPNCSQYTGIVREDVLVLAASQYSKVEKQDETEAGNQLICLENYMRGLQTELEECESQVLTVFQKILDEDQTKLIFDQMCRNSDVESVREIVNSFFDEINYESTHPTPVIEPEYFPDESANTAEEMELRRTEVSEELEQLQLELDQATAEKDIIFNNLVNVSDRRVYVEERLLELAQTGESDSEEGQRLSAELPVLLAEEAKWKSELRIIHGLVEEIEEEMKLLLSEELRLEMQLGIMPEQTEEPSSEPEIAVDDFTDIMGPGPVIIEEIPADRESTEDRVEVDPIPENSPNVDDIDTLIDFIFTEKPHEERHSRKLPVYAFGALIGILLVLGTLFVFLCIPLLVLKNRKKARKVPYDRASLAEKDPALLLKQTGFENPIYKFYAETSSKEDN